MTATIQQVSSDSSAELARRMARVISSLISIRGTTSAEVMAELGLPRRTWYRRIGDGQWTAPQLERLAALLRVEVGVLFAHPDDLLAGGQKLKIRGPELALVSGDGVPAAAVQHRTRPAHLSVVDPGELAE